MKVIMVAAVSTDGFLTRGSEPNVSSWTSVEDKKFFADIKSNHSMFIMGRKTYESAYIKPEPGTLRIIITRNPERYKNLEIAGQIEFTSNVATEIVEKYQNSYDSCLLLGGGEIYEQFLRQNLVDEIYLTVEPLMHGAGTPLLASGSKLSKFLDNIKPTTEVLNSAGTELLYYILKPKINN